MIPFDFKRKEERIDGKAYESPYYIRDEQSFCFVGNKSLGVSCHRLVEVACLEEEKAHEEERPCHYFTPPVVILVTTESDDVEHDHTDDADATQEVKGVIAFSHDCEVTIFFLYRPDSQGTFSRYGVIHVQVMRINNIIRITSSQ